MKKNSPREKPEDLDSDLPTPKGKTARITAFVNSGLMVCKVSGKASTAILILVKQTSIDWYWKLHHSVETETYGAEIDAARTATDKIVGTQYILHSMGVPLEESA